MDNKTQLSIGVKVIAWYAILTAAVGLWLDQSQLGIRAYLAEHPVAPSPYINSSAALRGVSNIKLAADGVTHLMMLIAGIALLRRKGWARFWMLCASVKDLVAMLPYVGSLRASFPFNMFELSWELAFIGLSGFIIYFLLRRTVRTQVTNTSHPIRVAVVLVAGLLFITDIVVRRTVIAAMHQTEKPSSSGSGGTLR